MDGYSDTREQRQATDRELAGCSVSLQRHRRCEKHVFLDTVFMIVHHRSFETSQLHPWQLFQGKRKSCLSNPQHSAFRRALSKLSYQGNSAARVQVYSRTEHKEKEKEKRRAGFEPMTLCFLGEWSLLDKPLCYGTVYSHLVCRRRPG